MRLKVFYYLFVFLTAISLLSARAQAQYVDSKFTLISAYIYKFTQFTTWPSAAVNNAFTVCVFGQDPFGSKLEPIKARKVNDKRIILKYYDTVNEDMSSCNMLYVAPSEKSKLKDILSPLRGLPVLTMSDIAGFSNSGGMVEFKLENGKIGIWVSLSAVRVRGLAINSKLLSLENMNIR